MIFEITRSGFLLLLNNSSGRKPARTKIRKINLITAREGVRFP